MGTVWFAKFEYWKSSTIVHQADPESRFHDALCGQLCGEMAEPIYFGSDSSETQKMRDFAVQLGVDPDTVSCKKCLKLIVKKTTKVVKRR